MSAGSAAERDGVVRGLIRSILDRCAAVAAPEDLRSARPLRVVRATRLAALLAEAVDRAPAARAERVRADLSRSLEKRSQDLHRSRALEHELAEARATIARLGSEVEAAVARKVKEDAGRDSLRRALSEEEEARVRANELALIAARAELERAHARLRERALEVERAVRAGEAARERARGLEAEAVARREEIAALEARLAEALAADVARRARAERTAPEEAPSAAAAAPEDVAADEADAVLDRVAGILGGGRAS